MKKNKGERLSGIFSLFILPVLCPFLMVAHTPSFQGDNLLDVERITVEQGLSHNTVIFIFQDRLGWLWFGTGYGVNRYDGYRYENYRHDEREFAYSSWIKTMAQDRSGNYWFGTTAGLTRRDKKTGEFVFYRHNPEAPGTICSNDINTIQVAIHTGSDVLWVGTDNGLCSIIMPGTPGGNLKIKNYYPDSPDGSGLAGNHITSLLESRRRGGRSLWIGTRTGLSQLILNETNPADHKETFVNFSSDTGGNNILSGKAITSLCEIPPAKGNSPDLFVGTTAGLNRLHWDEQGKLHIKHYKNEPENPLSLSQNHVTAIKVDTLNEAEPGYGID